MGNWNELVSAARVAILPAPELRGVTLAQWILESGRGKSGLAVQHNNYSGLKYRPEMEGYCAPVEYGAHDGVDTYCSFPSVQHFILGYWRFISRAVYTGWQAFNEDPQGYLAHLKAKGYATDKDYVSKVLALLPEAEALLAAAPAAPAVIGTEPERPGRQELGIKADNSLDIDDIPDFVTLGEVRHVFQGNRPNGLEGAIIHYDAGRSRPNKGPDNTEIGARNTLAHAVENKFAYVTISRSGKIYLPGNMDWEKWGYHAGESLCPTTGRSSVSRFFVGFEINSPGLVYPTEGGEKFVPWFDAEYEVITDKGKSFRRVKLDKQGHAKIIKPNPELYTREQVRIVKSKTANIRPGAYVPYTGQQVESLISVLLWLQRSYPRTFRLDYVFGHDEVSPDRKVDPGGSLGLPSAKGIGSPLPMADFRALLLKKSAERQLPVS